MTRILLAALLVGAWSWPARAASPAAKGAKKDYLAQLQSGDEKARAEAALLLKSNPRAVAALVRALETDPSDEVKLWAAFSLGELQNRAAQPALLKFLATRPEKATRTYYLAGEKGPHPGDIVRRNVCWALGLAGDERAVDALVREARRAKDWEVRYYAVGALARIGGPKALPALKKIAATDPYKRKWENTYIVREQAKRAIQAIQSKSAAKR